MIQKIRLTEKDGSKRIIGSYDTEKKVFTTNRHKTKHLLRKYNAWGIDKKFITEHLVPWGATIRIIEESTKKVYTITAKDFLKYGQEVNYYEHNPQLCVKKDYFNK